MVRTARLTGSIDFRARRPPAGGGNGRWWRQSSQRLRSMGSVRTSEDPEEQYARYASQRPTILPKIGSANADANIRWNRETLDRPRAGDIKGIPAYEPSHRLDRIHPSEALEFWTGCADTVGRFCNCPRSNPALSSFGWKRVIRALPQNPSCQSLTTAEMATRHFPPSLGDARRHRRVSLGNALRPARCASFTAPPAW
jgi:hypothetical protein